jgi:DNA-3-methyladenine glycosylase
MHRYSIQDIVSMNSVSAAPLLLGWQISRRAPEGTVRLKIVETEAYRQTDPASHSFAGITKRTAPMFEAGGRLYVYFTYGMHYCVNIVTGPTGEGEAVLLRAAEPIDGIDIMKRRRGIDELKNLANGPGKLAQCLGITDTVLSGTLLGVEISLEAPTESVSPSDISIGPRVGIKKAIEQPWRFYLSGNPYVSKPWR